MDKRPVTILVADDDPAYRELLAAIAGQLGVTIVPLKDGSEVLQWLLTGRPDLILLDIAMPGFDGLSVCRHIREQRQDLRLVPIAIITSYTEESTRQAALDAGADLFVQKPVRARDLLAALEELLEIKTIGEELDQEDLAERLTMALASRPGGQVPR